MAAQDPILLETIRQAPGITVTALAAREHMRPPAMTEHVRRLERNGVISRSQDNPNDRRQIGLRITPKGVRALKLVKKQRTDWLAGRLAELSPVDQAVIRIALVALNQLREDT